jgi:hypothetical protein
VSGHYQPDQQSLESAEGCERPDDRDERSFIVTLFTFELSCPSLLHFAHAQHVEDGHNRIRYSSAMTGSRDANAQAAMQYLIWALEDIEKTGNQKAAKHARIALKVLREGSTPPIS